MASLQWLLLDCWGRRGGLKLRCGRGGKCWRRNMRLSVGRKKSFATDLHGFTRIRNPSETFTIFWCFLSPLFFISFHYSSGSVVASNGSIHGGACGWEVKGFITEGTGVTG